MNYEIYVYLSQYFCACVLLLKVLCFSTENKTGLNEVRKIDVHVTDLNDEYCEVAEEACESDKIYYFILGECIRLLYRVFM
jgi:hypothetical protein